MDSTHPGPQHAGLLELINASWTTQAIRTACMLRVPERLAGSASEAAAIAADLGCHAASLERLLRALASLGLCSADAQGRYALTASGELLRDDHPHSLRAWALLAGGVSWQRWAELDASVRSGLSHRQRHNGHDGFEDLGSSPSAAAGFHRAMVDITRPVAIAVARAIDARAARLVVDVGGSSGELLAHVLAAHPGPRGVLFDLPHGLEGASAVLERAGVASRCTLVAGSFFDSVPAGGDLYLLKSVLHNWDDERCRQILRNCRQAMAPGGRLLVIERVMAEPVGTSAQDRAVARSDLNMLVALTGRERRAGEFAALFAAAGLALQRDLAAAGEFRILQVIAN